MNDLTKAQLIAKIATLPQDLQDAIAAPETLEKLEMIGKKYELDIIHIGLLHRLTVKLLAGVIAPQEFVAAIENDLGLEHEQSMFIAQEINRNIFNAVKESLRTMHSLPKTSGVQTPAEQTVRPLGTVPVAPKPPVKFNIPPTRGVTFAIEPQKPLHTEVKPKVEEQPQPIFQSSAPERQEITIGGRAPIAAPKPMPKFSVASALGNIPATAPAPIAPASSTSAPQEVPKSHVGNIFEEKLGGAFTLPAEKAAPVPMKAPTQIIPPAPQATAVPQAPRVDPYREAA